MWLSRRLGEDEMRCPNVASHRFTWPGREESFVCLGHYEKVRNISSAMGFPCQLIPIHESEHDGELCRQELSIN